MTTPITAEDMAKLRELATHAVPGPWKIGNLASYEGDTGKAFRQVWPEDPAVEDFVVRVVSPYCDDTAAFIAAFNPATALALLDQLEAARAVAMEEAANICMDLTRPDSTGDWTSGTVDCAQAIMNHAIATKGENT